MNNVLIMALAVLAGLITTSAGVLLIPAAPEAGWALLGLGLLFGFLGAQAARRHRKESGR